MDPSQFTTDALVQSVFRDDCGIFVQGNGFGQSEKGSGGVVPAHMLFLTDKLGLLFRNPS